VINYDNFSSVMSAASKGDNDISIAVNGTIVKLSHDGVLKAKGANQFHLAVKEEYERQKSEANKETRGEDTPQSDSGRQDRATDQYRGGATSTENDYERGEAGMDLKELLTDRLNHLKEVEERLSFEKDVIQDDLASTGDKIDEIELALKAIEQVRKGNGPKDTSD